MEEKAKILLVEDDKIDQMAFERLVKRENLPYDYQVAGSVEEGKQALAEGRFDAVLLDYLLGDGTAFDLLDEVQDSPTVILTGSGDEEIAVRAMKAGAFDYMIKDPAGNYLKMLANTVKNVIGRWRAEEELKRYREHLEELVAERAVELTQVNAQLLAEIAERERAEEALKRRMEQLSALGQTSQAVTSSLKLDQVLAQIVSLASEVVAADYTSVVLADEAGHLSGSTENVPDVPSIEHRIRDEGLTSWIMRSRQGVVIDEIGEDGAVTPALGEGAPRFANSFIVEAGVKSVAGLPLESKGRLLGVLYLHSLRPAAFQGQLPLLITFANQVAIAIENARLYEAVQRELAERVRSEDERARTEELLRESEQKYRTILESIQDGYYEVDLAGNLVFFNDSLCRMLGYSPDELMGLNNREFMDDETARAVYQTFNEIYRTGNPVEAVDWSLTRKDGDRRLVETSVSLMSDPTGEIIGYRGIARDITERKHIEQQLHRQERLAAVGQLAGGIAHDFNNMLTVVNLFAHQILRQEQLSARTVSAAETIIKESQRAAKLVGQILDFSRRSPLEISPMDLKPFIKETVRVLERTLPESIHLHLDARAGKYVIRGDPTRIQQVLMNLVVNARDAMPEGGDLRIDLSRVEVSLSDEPPVIEMVPGEWICLAVSDTGTGIPPHVLDHIFEPFFTTKEPGKGTGLGLAQVHGIVAQHGGRVGVETEVGKGTTFRVYLPAFGSEEEVVEEGALSIPQGQGETILLVEDNEQLREGGRDLLESSGYRVLTAANGRGALEVCRTVKGIALVITDLVMPEMGGKQLMQELGRAIPALKVLALTGYAVEQSRDELKKAGFLDVVYKPFDVGMLAQVIRRALDEE